MGRSHISLHLFITITIIICSNINLIWCGFLLTGNCSSITVGDLGSTTNFSQAGVVGQSTGGAGVQILGFNVLCISPSVRRNTYLTAVVAVHYNCLECFQSLPGNITNVTNVYTLRCGDLNIWTITGIHPVPLTSLSTLLEKRCALCTGPSNFGSSPNYDNSTFCLRKNWPLIN